MLSAAFEADGRTLTLMPGKMAPPPGRTVQLWVIPADGRPRSLGMLGGTAERMAIAPEMVEHFHEQPMLALSIEPKGGAPGGQPSGPMVASGQLRNV
jgi:anti-sigma-K factor RskA